jgi:hypothetical protein
MQERPGLNHRYCGRALAGSLLLSLAAGSTQAQSTKLAERFCASCALAVSWAADLADATPNSAPPGTATAGVRLPSGELLIVYAESPFEIVRHRPDGRIAGQVGRKGKGPNEFGLITQLIALPGDSVVALDEGNRQIITLDPQLREVRRMPAPLVFFDAVITARGSFVASGVKNSRESIGFPLHLVGSNGAIVRSFGTDEPVFRPDIRVVLSRRVTAARTGGFWSTHVNEYVVEHWNDSLRMTRELVRDASWFRPWVKRTPGQARPGVVADVAETPDGLLIVMVRVPEAGDGGATSSNQRREFDTMIEVVDPRTSTVLASKRVDQAFTQFLDANHAVLPYERDDEPRLAIWRITFTKPGG